MERLAGVTKALYDVVSKAFPGGGKCATVSTIARRTLTRTSGAVPYPFPTEILETHDSPNIMVTSPTTSGMQTFQPSLHNMNNQSLHSLHLSPGSSPTAPDFPSHTHTPHSLSRQHSFQHIPEYPPAGSMHSQAHAHLVSNARYEPAMTPLPPSLGPNSGPMDFEDSQGRKRQRTTGGADDHVGVGVGVVGGEKHEARFSSEPGTGSTSSPPRLPWPGPRPIQI